MTLVGFLAPLVPPLELTNHFRPLTLGGCLIGLVISFGFGRRPAATGLAVLAGLNACIVLAASSFAAPSGVGPADRHLKIVTFNVYSANDRLPDVATWIVAQDADIVVLQEITGRSKPGLMPTLKSAFAHVYDCECNDIVIASKRPWIGAGGHGRTAKLPSWSWIDLDAEAGRRLRIIGMRPYYPYRANEQAVRYAWIETQLAAPQQPMIVIGDFNLTPWSWKMLRLSYQTGLLRHGTWARSWPAQDNWPNIPAFLIDNVLASPQIKSVGFDTGPWLGSDHLPVVATVGLP
jgi:endonuclease/exonuclease/phosphatase (EEP) superfamily protein YafD